MSHTLSTSISNGITIGGTVSPYQDPFTVTQTGTIINNAASTYATGIYGVGGGKLSPEYPLTLTNYGLIEASSGIGVEAGRYGDVTNAGTGRIGGGVTGVDLYFGNVKNIGLDAMISGGSFGVHISTRYPGTNSVYNSGSISGGSGTGVFMTGVFGDSAVTNTGAGALISGDTGVFVLNGQDNTISNAATIDGTYFGVLLQGNGTVINSGTISGASLAVEIYEIGTAGVNRLIVAPTAVFDGTVAALPILNGPTGSVTLELTTGSSAGTISGIGTQFLGFNTIAIDTGATWLLDGNSAGLASGQTITGFAAGDTIDLADFAATSASFIAPSTLVLTNATGSETLDLAGDMGPIMFSSDGAAGTDLAMCYMRGTNIVTADGERPVEDIRIGDLVATRTGLRPVKWIGRQRYARRFIARNRNKIPVRIHPGALGPNLPRRDLFVSPGHSMLVGDVLVLCRSLVNGITVTQDLHDPALPENIDYFHVELDTHDCLLAEGAWSEAFADGPGLRAAYENADEFHALYPDTPMPDTVTLCAPRPESGPALEHALRPILDHAAAGIRPGLLEGYVETIEEDRVIGWARDMSLPDFPVLLQVWAADRLIGTVLACDYRGDLEEAGKGAGRCAFTFHTPEKLSAFEMSTLQVCRARDEKLPLSDGGQAARLKRTA